MLSLHSRLLRKLEDDRDKNVFLCQTCDLVPEMERLEKQYEDVARHWVDKKKWFDISFPVRRWPRDCIDCGGRIFDRIVGYRVCVQCHSMQEVYDDEDKLYIPQKLGPNLRFLIFKKYLEQYRGVNPINTGEEILNDLESKLDVLGWPRRTYY